MWATVISGGSRSLPSAVVLGAWRYAEQLCRDAAASCIERDHLGNDRLKKLAAYRRQNRLDFALQELGRIERTLFTLDWLESRALRQQCQAGLNKGEARHTLAQAVFVHKQGRLRDPQFENQALKASGLTLVTAAIVYWNTLYMGRAVEHLRASGEPALDELLGHVAPLGWRHISLTGDYLWQDAAAELDQDGYRALNIAGGPAAKVA